jgi:uncharacterized glyoxalase superfamily protein PhnB
MPSPVFDQLNLISDDLDSTVRFYRRLGLDMVEPARTADGEPFHASSKADTGALLEADSSAFARVWNRGWQRQADLNGRVVIGLSVADRPSVDRLYGEIVGAGHKGLQPPFDAFWGARYAIVEDPDGRAVGLMSPADDRHRSPPPF